MSLIKHVDVAIIGAGSAGLVALKEVLKKTKKVVMIDEGPLGTTCARVGCMPSKVLISVAQDFARRKVFEETGITGSDSLKVDGQKVMEHVRNLRDFYAGSVIKSMKEDEEYLVRGKAQLKSLQSIVVDGVEYRTQKIIFANGSETFYPDEFKNLGPQLINSDEFFEMKNLPQSLDVIGLGVIGLELGLAAAQLGVKVTGHSKGQWIGGLSDPKINEVALDLFKEHMSIQVGTSPLVKKGPGGILEVHSAQGVSTPEKVLLAVGRKPRLMSMQLEQFGVELNEKGLPFIDSSTQKIKDHDLFVAGDAAGYRPVLHEVSDDGYIAGSNASAEKIQCFKRKTFLSITFTHPQIAVVGKRFKDLSSPESLLIGEVDFAKQGRARAMLENQGFLRIYAQKETGKILGSEMIAPDAEHLAHLLSWSIQQGMSVFDVLEMPFYHPVVEEGLRTALTDVARQIPKSHHPSYRLEECSTKSLM